VDIFVTIDSVDDPLLIEVRFSTASSLAHHKITQEKHYCNWNVNEIKQWETLTTKLLRAPQTSISPLRTKQSQPTRQKTAPVTSIVPSTSLALAAENFPRLVSSALTLAPKPTSSSSMIPHHNSPSIENIIAAAVARELSQFKEATAQSEQVLADKLTAIESSQASSVDRDHTTSELLAGYSLANTAMMAMIAKLTIAVNSLQGPPPSCSSTLGCETA